MQPTLYQSRSDLGCSCKQDPGKPCAYWDFLLFTLFSVCLYTVRYRIPLKIVNNVVKLPR